MRRNKKTAAKAMIVYIVMTVGMWMFLYSYANSYNKLTDEKISPALLETEGDEIRLEIAGMVFHPERDMLDPENKLYFAAYLVMPTELRYSIKTCSHLFSHNAHVENVWGNRYSGREVTSS